MSDAPWQLQKAIYGALTANSTLTGLADIYDGAPLDAALPYVDIGEAEAYDWSTKTEGGTDHRIMMHVWSNYRGKKEVFSIISEIRSTLHEAELSVTGHSLVLLRFENDDIFRDIDGQTWHGRVEFRAFTQDT